MSSKINKSVLKAALIVLESFDMEDILRESNPGKERMNKRKEYFANAKDAAKNQDEENLKRRMKEKAAEYMENARDLSAKGKHAEAAEAKKKAFKIFELLKKITPKSTVGKVAAGVGVGAATAGGAYAAYKHNKK